MRILVNRWGAVVGDLEQVYLAGAFGNYIRPCSAAKIGMLEMDVERVVAAGNTALRGTKMLFGRERPLELDRIEHISLAAEPRFQDFFIECLDFPGGSRRHSLPMKKQGEVRAGS